MSIPEDPTTLLTSHTQAQSTPLLQWCGKDVVKPYTKSKEYSDDIESSSTSSVHIPMKVSQAKKSKNKKKTKTSGSKQNDSIKLKPTQRSSDASLSTVNLVSNRTNKICIFVLLYMKVPIIIIRLKIYYL